MTERLAALKNGDEVDFIQNKCPRCPHCGDVYDIDENEAWNLYDENFDEKIDCPNCDLEFQVDVVVTYAFSTYEQDYDDED